MNPNKVFKLWIQIDENYHLFILNPAPLNDELDLDCNG